jgi:carbon-monoxide dehydrogenase large subunit
VGESPNVGSPPAIVNAVIDALHETHGVDTSTCRAPRRASGRAMQGRAEPPQ